MSMIRQIWLLLTAVILLALVGSLGVTIVSERDTLETQLRLKNNDNAQALALALSQQHGDAALMELLMAAQFDTGFYRSIQLVRGDGKVVFDRQGDAQPAQAPAWFVHALPIASTPGVGLVSDGWRALGALHVVSHVAYAYDDLWRSALRTTAWMLCVALGAGVLATSAVRRLRQPLEATVEQANALVEGRYVTVPEPRVPELRRLSAAMNGMVQRVRALFEAQAAQLEVLRRQAHCDPLTGVLHRAHFMQRLEAVLQREDDTGAGGLVLVRLADLAGLNLLLGRDSTDRALLLVARALQAYPERVPECFVGRLNGADFALCLPTPGIACETGESLASALRASLLALSGRTCVHIGGVEVRPGQRPGELLSSADRALANAESRGPFEVEVIEDAAQRTAHGEQAWRQQIVEALAAGRSRLMNFPVLDRDGQLVHFECPLRIRLEPDSDFEPAARWLPLAARSRLTASVDAHALQLALREIARDGLPRGLNVAGSSLNDGTFAAQARNLLGEAPVQAPQVWLEVDESAVISHFEAVQEFARLVRPLGVHFGLEHAGQRLHRIERLYELGLDYVKLDASLCRGVAHDEAAREFVRSTAALLHALSIQVQAEGVIEGADADALWACGIDAITGPWASARRPAAD